MDDQLDKLLKANRETLFDDYPLADAHEKRFEQRLKKQKFGQKYIFHWYHYAAMLLPVCLVLGFLYWSQNPVNSHDNSSDLAMYSKVLDEKNDAFAVILESKLAQIEAYKTPENKAMITQSLTELQKLETEYDNLLHDLEKSGGNPNVAQSIIENLKLRITVLEQLIENLKFKSKFNQVQNENIL